MSFFKSSTLTKLELITQLILLVIDYPIKYLRNPLIVFQCDYSITPRAKAVALSRDICPDPRGGLSAEGGSIDLGYDIVIAYAVVAVSAAAVVAFACAL